MIRPCFLVIDHEFASSISTRKLVIETAKMNVITAYGSEEAIATLDRFPRVDGIVLNANMKDMSCADLLRALKQRAPSVPIVLVVGTSRTPCPGADHYLHSFYPTELLNLLRKLTPEASAAIAQHDAALNEQVSASV